MSRSSDPSQPVAPAPSKAQLVESLASARLALTAATNSLQQATDLRSRARTELPGALTRLLRRHPLPISLGASLIGFIGSRLLVRRPKKIIVERRAGPGLLGQLVLAAAGFFLKPVLQEAAKDFVMGRMKSPSTRR